MGTDAPAGVAGQWQRWLPNIPDGLMDVAFVKAPAPGGRPPAGRVPAPRATPRDRMTTTPPETGDALIDVGGCVPARAATENRYVVRAINTAACRNRLASRPSPGRPPPKPRKPAAQKNGR